MSKLPFSLYDFFGYLAGGVVWMLAIDVVFLGGYGEIEPGDKWTAIGLFVVLVYVLGHVNSHVAAWLIEKKLIGALGFPSTTLFEEPQVAYKVFRGFRKALPEPLRERILTRYDEACGDRTAGEAMFLYCFHRVKEKCPRAHERLQSFMGLYGFCRNISFALFAISIASGIVGGLRKDLDLLAPVLAALAISYVLFLRALKFFRHYSVEVFASYGTMDEE